MSLLLFVRFNVPISIGMLFIAIRLKMMLLLFHLNKLIMKKYSKEILFTALLTGLMAALSYLLSSCSGLQTQIRGKSDVFRCDTIHTIFYYDKPQRSVINVDY